MLFEFLMQLVAGDWMNDFRTHAEDPQKSAGRFRVSTSPQPPLYKRYKLVNGYRNHV